MLDHIFWKISGVILWTLIALYTVLRTILGKNWSVKLGSNLFLGLGLKKAARKMISEFKQGKVEDTTITDVAVHVFWRLTRIGIIGLMIAGFPIFLLIQQNELLKDQNVLFSLQDDLIMAQNEKLDSQLVMFDYQNNRVNRQTVLLETQTDLFSKQNTLVSEQNRFVSFQTSLLETQNRLFTAQNAKVDTQNIRLNMQNNLIEADRRSSLVLLMSNLLTDVKDEITEQKLNISIDSLAKLQEKGFALSGSLIGRTAALSQGFLPYRLLKGDTLTDKEYSVERGQLLLSLLNSNLDSITYLNINSKVTFNQCYLVKTSLVNANLSEAQLREVDFTNAVLNEANLVGTNLMGTNFTRAVLSKTNLQGAHLSNTNFTRANLYETNIADTYSVSADFTGADLFRAKFQNAKLQNAIFTNANLYGVDFTNAQNLTKQQLLSSRNLYGAKGIEQWKEELRIEKPCLFVKSGCTSRDVE